LREEVAAGRFREDLFYRLNVFPLTLPPLRERPRDVKPLVEYMMQRFLKADEKTPQLTEAAWQRLYDHKWPGNVRELGNVVQRMLILRRGDEISAEDLCFENEEISAVSLPREPEPSISMSNPEPVNTVDSPDESFYQPQTLDDAGAANGLNRDLKSVEERMILDALTSGQGSRKVAAEILGISPRTLRYKIARMRDAGIQIPR